MPGSLQQCAPKGRVEATPNTGSGLSNPAPNRSNQLPAYTNWKMLLYLETRINQKVFLQCHLVSNKSK